MVVLRGGRNTYRLLTKTKKSGVLASVHNICNVSSNYSRYTWMVGDRGEVRSTVGPKTIETCMVGCLNACSPKLLSNDGC